MLISAYSIIIGMIIMLVPFMGGYILIKKMQKKSDTQASLEDRIRILEAEVQLLKNKLEDF